MKILKQLNLFLFSLLCGITAQSYSQTLLTCEVQGHPEGFEEWTSTMFLITDEIIEYGGCGLTPAIMVGIVDTNCQFLGTKYEGENPDNDFGNFNSEGGCRPRVERHFCFYQNDAEQLDSLENLLRNKIPEGYSVLLYSWFTLDSAAITDHSATLIPTLNDMGWDNFGNQNDVPFILYGRLGNPDSFQEVYGENPDDFITFSDSICLPLPVEDDEPDEGASLPEVESSFGEITIFPQPSNGPVSIVIDARKNGPFTLTLTDITGKTIFLHNGQLKVGENKFEINATNSPSGIYILHLSSPNGTANRKVMIR